MSSLLNDPIVGLMIRESQDRIKAGRDEMAWQALNSLLANPSGPVQANASSGWAFTNCTPQDAASVAYEIADAFLAERDKQRGGK